MRSACDVMLPSLFCEVQPLQPGCLQAGRAGDAFDWSMALSIYAHPTTTERNIVGAAMGPFVFAANMFTFVMLVSLPLHEPERQVVHRSL